LPSKPYATWISSEKLPKIEKSPKIDENIKKMRNLKK
jgi:hypothetical protein